MNLNQTELSALRDQFDCDAVLMMDYTPILGQSAAGRIYADRQNRFSDTVPVRTSTVTSVSMLENNYIKLQTRNTTYLVIISGK